MVGTLALKKQLNLLKADTIQAVVIETIAQMQGTGAKDFRLKLSYSMKN